jgi:hypothetical protein
MIVTLTCPHCGKDRSYQRTPIPECPHCQTPYPEDLRRKAEAKLPQKIPNARHARLGHWTFLAADVALITAMGLFLHFAPVGYIGHAVEIATIFAAVGIVLIVIAVVVVRPKIPLRSPEQSADAYWVDAMRWVAAAWMLLTVAVAICAIGYLVTKVVFPGAVAWLAIFVLAWLRPGAFDALGEE